MVRHLVLVGLPGAGKSVVGRALARRLGIPLVDVDAAITASGRSIDGWFRERGEAAFRAEEQRIVREAVTGPVAVVVPGGGWAAMPGAVEMVREAGALVVHLAVTPDTAGSRIGPRHGRPLLGDAASTPARLRELADARMPAYRTADLTVDTERRTVPQVVEAILSGLRSGAVP